MKNLVIGVVGDKSLHHNWLERSPDFDLMLVYYGQDGNRYKNDCDHYFYGVRGSKWSILDSLKEDLDKLQSQYDFIFVPDDDILMRADTINRVFEFAAEYNLHICQPAIAGWISVPFCMPCPLTKMRFTNWVEIMCPCFSSFAFNVSRPTFGYNKSNWGISYLWNKLLGNPKDKIAILDEVIAVHTRPSGSGENYKLNESVQRALAEMNQILRENDINGNKTVYHAVTISENEFYQSQSDRFFPNTPIMKEAVELIRKKNVKVI
jgi:hypothetical protein